MTVREDSINKESSSRVEGAAMEDIDLPVTVNGSGRTIIGGNIKKSVETVTLTIDTTGAAVIADSDQMDTTNEGSVTSTNAVKETMAEPSSDGDMNAIHGDSDGDGDDETTTGISEPASAMKFQPLQPISEKSLFPNPHQSNPENSSTQDQSATQISTVIATKESGSFMNNLQDPVAASKVFKKSQAENGDENSSFRQQMSHTPPTSMSTTYETMHFGKRSRSGVSLFVA